MKKCATGKENVKEIEGNDVCCMYKKCWGKRWVTNRTADKATKNRMRMVQWMSGNIIE